MNEEHPLSKAISEMQKIMSESLKDYTLEQRQQIAKEIMDDYRSGKQ